jgi:hypothetical protein
VGCEVEKFSRSLAGGEACRYRLLESLARGAEVRLALEVSE